MAEYAERRLRREDLPDDPMRLFEDWFGQARGAEPWEGRAMTLCTADSVGAPSGRMVLLRGFDPGGFVFYTHYHSRKGRALERQPMAALVFWWPSQVRQVRVEGMAERLEPALSDAYFESRPRASRIGAWASPQSEEISRLSELEQRVTRFEAQFAGKAVPRPSEWGGYRVRPSRIEFWQGGAARLHDRFSYARETSADAWRMARLAP